MNNDKFDSEKKEIGKGRQATVYLWQGFAYKVYNRERPQERIDYEIRIQTEICKTSLPVARYYESENPGVIKMDYVEGITLGEKMLKEKYKHGLEDMLRLQYQVHQNVNMPVPGFRAETEARILVSACEQEQKALAMRCLYEIEDGTALCHLDFHPMNIIHSGEKYYIIDWENTKSGNPVFDFAMSYVILFENAYRFSKKYLSLLKKDKQNSITDLEKAIYITALLRRNNENQEKMNKLISGMYEKITLAGG